MTYDQWKTDSGYDERDPEPELSELERVYEDLFAKAEELKGAKERIAQLEAEAKKMVSALWECETYFLERQDVVDGSYGEPAPNREMTLLQEVLAALGNNIRF